MSVQQFTDYLTGTTIIVCHPTREQAVRDGLVAGAPPKKSYRVQVDPDCPEDKVFLTPPPSLPEWSP